MVLVLKKEAVECSGAVVPPLATAPELYVTPEKKVLGGGAFESVREREELFCFDEKMF